MIALIMQIDYSHAKQTVLPFIHDTRSLDVWNADFFCSITDNLKINVNIK